MPQTCVKNQQLLRQVIDAAYDPTNGAIEVPTAAVAVLALD